MKFVPVISTVVFPLVEPLLGVTEITEVAALYVKLDADEVPPGEVTCTPTVPVPDGEIAVI